MSSYLVWDVGIAAEAGISWNHVEHGVDSKSQGQKGDDLSGARIEWDANDGTTAQATSYC